MTKELVRAQDLYQKQNRTGKLDSYPVVRIGSKGHAVIEDLVVGGISLKKELQE